MAAVTPVGTAPAPTGLDEQRIKDRLVGMFNELVHVRVITVVGNATVTMGRNGETRPTVDIGEAPHNEAIVTIFNLVDGDVTNVIAPALKDDQAMRDFHAAQVEKSMAVLPSNIAAIGQFGKELIDLLKS